MAIFAINITFCTFEFETHALRVDGSWLLAVTYMFGRVFVGLMALRVGMVVARGWLS